MQSSTFTFRASDGVEIFVYTWLPDGPVRGVVQIAHGMAEHAARYEHVARALTERGFAVYADDHRGHGGTAKNESDVGHFADDGGWDKVLGDLRQLQGIAGAAHPGVPFVLFGHSMGSFFTQNFMFAYPGSIDGAVLSGSNGKVGALATMGSAIAALERLRLGKRGKSALLDKISFGAFNDAFRPARTPFDWLSRDRREVDRYIADPQCGFLVSAQLWSDLLGGLRRIEDPRNQARVPKQLPVYVFSGARDPVSNNLQQLLRAYAAAGLENVESRIYPEGRHEMLNETNRDEVIADLLAWLERLLQAPRSPPAASPPPSPSRHTPGSA
jgi:alpha-beta hydrolase superfamily lysophospholipase